MVFKVMSFPTPFVEETAFQIVKELFHNWIVVFEPKKIKD